MHLLHQVTPDIRPHHLRHSRTRRALATVPEHLHRREVLNIHQWAETRLSSWSRLMNELNSRLHNLAHPLILTLEALWEADRRASPHRNWPLGTLIHL